MAPKPEHHAQKDLSPRVEGSLDGSGQVITEAHAAPVVRVRSLEPFAETEATIGRCSGVGGVLHRGTKAPNRWSPRHKAVRAASSQEERIINVATVKIKELAFDGVDKACVYPF